VRKTTRDDAPSLSWNGMGSKEEEEEEEEEEGVGVA
jgi:hypothetical protein